MRTKPQIQADELQAAMALRSTKDKDELVAAWWSSCEHHTGDARERLQETYTEMLAKFAPMARAG
jgi:hypothetical protein